MDISEDYAIIFVTIDQVFMSVVNEVTTEIQC